MKRFLVNIENAFKNYVSHVDNFYIESTKGYSKLFENNLPGTFFRAISHVMRQFLESDADSLFIQIPVDELASNKAEQDGNFFKFEEAISHTLAMAVYPGTLNAQNLDDLNCGDFYYTADNVKCRGGENRPRFWKIKKDNTGRKYPSEQFPDTSKYNVPISIGKFNDLCEIFENHRYNTYKLDHLPDNNHKTTREAMMKMAQMLGIYKANKTHKHYENALIVGFGAPSSLISNYPYLSYPINFVNNYTTIKNDQQYCVTVFVGDCKYKGYEGTINNRLAKGHTKKVIYIGSNKPDHYNGLTFSFSPREMYHYFANDKFPNFEIDKINWNSLNEIINSISEILHDDSLNIQEDLIKRVISYAITPFIGYSLFNSEDSIEDRLLNILNEELSLTDEQWETLVKKMEEKQQIRLDGNPKKEMFSTIKAATEGNKCTLLEPYTSYTNKIKDVCQNNKMGNTYVIDVFSDSEKYIDIVRCLFKKLALGNVHLLTYFNLNKIKDFLSGESKIYNQEYRKSVLDGLSYSATSNEKPTTYGSLDYFDYDTIDKLITSYKERTASPTYYTLISNDGKEYDVSGGIIRYNHEINAHELYEYAADWLPCEVSFYIKPEHFQQLRDILYDLPPGNDIDTYARLWKNRLQERCEEIYERKYQKMWENDNFKFIKQSVFKSYVNGNYNSRFPTIFSRLALNMKKLGILSEEEYIYSLKANTANKKTNIGRELKKGVYEFLLTKKCQVADMNAICANSQKSNSPLTHETLTDMCVKTIDVVEIKKTNKKRTNDDE